MRQEVAPFDQVYPNIARWLRSYGWVEIGQNGYSHSFIRVLDEGGMVWEGKVGYKTLDGALQDLEAGLTEWMTHYDGEKQ